jgi:hypothetical protein
MGVVERQERPVFVVVDQRSVERAAAEHAGADEVPERGAMEWGDAACPVRPSYAVGY